VKFGKIFKVFKKGSKLAGKGKGKAGAEFEWPSGLRIGVFGHANSGKTVTFTVLNEECKVSRDLQVSVTDNPTAAEFLRNYRAIWGLGSSTDVGTVVDLREDRKFPDPTQGDKILRFKAIVDRKQKISVVAYDYDGNAISISQKHDLADKVLDFMEGSHGLLFFFDPKALGAEIQCQAHVASFVHMLEQLAPLGRRVPIPIALVVSKADILPGFSEDRAVLISPEDEHFLAEDFESFLEKVLTSNRITSDSAWAGSVRDTLVKLKEFLKVVVGRTLDFQVFFTSNTGTTPEKIGTEVGRSVYAPPPKLTPVGVKAPFYWLLKSVIRNRRISVLRTVSRYVTILSIIWVGAYSLPHLYHFNWMLQSRTTNVEDNILAQYGGNHLNISNDERRDILRAYDRYERSWLARWIFPHFQVPAGRIREYYKTSDMNVAIVELDKQIGRMAALVADESLWPDPDPAGDSLILNTTTVNLLLQIERFHQGDEQSILFKRSSRAFVLWDLFTACVLNRADSTAWAKTVDKVELDQKLAGDELSRQEKDLGAALLSAAAARDQTQVDRITVVKAGSEFDDLVAEITRSSDPEYRLDKAVTRLKDLRAKLAGDPARAEDVARIDKYLNRTSYFDENRGYTFEVTNCPEDHHIHIRVKGRGKSGDWLMKGKQLKPGREYSITWRAGDHIDIALDHKNHESNNGVEGWGEGAKAVASLKGKFAIFKMSGNIRFPNTDLEISISFADKDDPNNRLPDF